MPHALVLFGIIYGTPLLIPCDDLSCLVLSWLITAISISDSLYHAIPVSQSYSMDSDIPQSLSNINASPLSLPHMMPPSIIKLQAFCLLHRQDQGIAQHFGQTFSRLLVPHQNNLTRTKCDSCTASFVTIRLRPFRGGRLGMLHQLLLVLLLLPSYGWTINYYRERTGLWRRDWITLMCSTARDSIGIDCSVSMLRNLLHHCFDVASISAIFTALKKTGTQPLDKFLTSTRAKHLQFCPFFDGFWSLSFPFSTYLQSHHLPSHCHPSWRRVGPNPVAKELKLNKPCEPLCVWLWSGFNSCTSNGTSSTTTGFSPSRWPSSACNLSIAYGKANSNGRTTPLCDKARILGFFGQVGRSSPYNEYLVSWQDDDWDNVGCSWQVNCIDGGVNPVSVMIARQQRYLQTVSSLWLTMIHQWFISDARI